MMIYLDDNFTDRALAGMLRHAGHTVFQPVDFGLVGASDACHLARAVRENLVVLTKDRVDFEELHRLVIVVGGSHPGIVAVRYKNNSKRDMQSKHVVRALARLDGSGLTLANAWVILNQWR